MDTEAARTFLAVVAAGNFVGAASRLHVTQSTVSARIQGLERELGAVLFQRGRAGAELTMAGKRFLRHAKHLLRTMEQARHELSLPDSYQGSLSLRARPALWDGFLPRWVAWMRERRPQLALRLESGYEEDITQGLLQGGVDIGLMYTPEQRSGLGIEYLFDERLLLVTSDADGQWRNPRYVHIDWGSEFEVQYATAFPEAEPPALLASIGWVGLQQILCSGGAGFFPERLVRGLIDSGSLFPVPGSPVFTLPAWLVYSTAAENEHLHEALDGLRQLAKQQPTNAAD